MQMSPAILFLCTAATQTFLDHKTSEWWQGSKETRALSHFRDGIIWRLLLKAVLVTAAQWMPAHFRLFWMQFTNTSSLLSGWEGRITWIPSCESCVSQDSYLSLQTRCWDKANVSIHFNKLWNQNTHDEMRISRCIFRDWWETATVTGSVKVVPFGLDVHTKVDLIFSWLSLELR